MTTIITTTDATGHQPKDHEPAAMSIHWGWLAGWAALTAAVGFEIVTHGITDRNGVLTAGFVAVAAGFFIAPDLTFLIGVGDEVPHGHLSPRAVPFYNALHRLWVPAALTTVVGVAAAPLSTASLLVFVGGLSWMAHISLDRAAGYGLRNADGSRRP